MDDTDAARIGFENSTLFYFCNKTYKGCQVNILYTSMI
jgi:hypothetical protein